MWTLFWDMNSGGNQKLEWSHIYIEANEDDAVQVFERTFGVDPLNVSCECCGNDYDICSEESIEKLTNFHRGGYFEKRPDASLDEYKKLSHVKFVYAQNN